MQINSSITFCSNTTEKKSSRKRQVSSAIVGAGIALPPSIYLIHSQLKPLTNKDLFTNEYAIRNLMPDIDDLPNIKNIAEKVLDETGLKAKGVKINIVNSSNANDVEKELLTYTKHELFAKQMIKNIVKMLEHGINACFVPNNNKVYIPETQTYSSVFHELGHAMNHNNSMLTKLLQKTRIFTPLGAPLAGLAIFLPTLFHSIKPEENNTPKSKTEKTKDFIKKNAGKLAFATSIPIIIEEGLASYKGIKAVKKHITPEQLKKLKGNYKAAWSTYAMTEIALCSAIGLANIVSTKIQKKHTS